MPVCDYRDDRWQVIGAIGVIDTRDITHSAKAEMLTRIGMINIPYLIRP